jgi:hypothetical protein
LGFQNNSWTPVGAMSEQTCILVLGLGLYASATARMLFLAGYSVAIQQASDPKVLRRKMSFADA